MQLDAALDAIRALASAQTLKTFRRHGAPDNALGVKVGDLKTVLKAAGHDHALALALWDSGIAEARYLAGLMVDPKRLGEAELDRWAEEADWSMLSECTVAWAATESPHALALARRWVESPRASVASSGWATWGGIVSYLPDAALPLDELSRLLERVRRTNASVSDRVRYCQNGFVIGLGAYVDALTDAAVQTATAVGRVDVDMGDTECKVPEAVQTITKARAKGTPKKKKTVRC